MFSIAVSLPIRDIIKVRPLIWLSCLAISLKTKKLKMLKIDGKKNSFPYHLHLVQLMVRYMHCVVLFLSVPSVALFIRLPQPTEEMKVQVSTSMSKKVFFLIIVDSFSKLKVWMKVIYSLYGMKRIIQLYNQTNTPYRKLNDPKRTNRDLEMEQ